MCLYTHELCQVSPLGLQAVTMLLQRNPATRPDAEEARG